MNKQKNEELKYWVAFNQITAIGPMRWQIIEKYFGSIKNAWQADMADWQKSPLDYKTIEKFFAVKNKIDPDYEMEKLQKHNLEVITAQDQNYPKILKEIYAAPPLLYYRGDIKNFEYLCLAIVGSRKNSDYGKQVTEQLSRQISEVGLTVVSGLALGVDAIAHQTAIKNSGRTIAILGSSLDQIYPASNRHLAEEIIKKDGLIISEFPIGTTPQPFNFPRRNRIIAGLSLGVLVTEAKINSGALITARYALEQNREVFAVPGNIYNENTAGTNQLIKLGARLVTDVNDILETLNLEKIQTQKIIEQIQPQTKNEKIIFEIIKLEPIHIDKIIQLARLDISAISATLSIMEMKGIIKNLGNQIYSKN
ncbi:MAG: DNA-processing protein DprA [Candidatus Buchananbacteria bacterium]|nr:DNA-processing protein DprA [Candidatus Buchananbacteria bacterium]